MVDFVFRASTKRHPEQVLAVPDASLFEYQVHICEFALQLKKLIAEENAFFRRSVLVPGPSFRHGFNKLMPDMSLTNDSSDFLLLVIA